ncbi:hypothetical protein MUY14_30100 [Amycolatopsis sp. FBCC-B4732]|uniref:hypothetical protein n=1 Tax=Amycolatopsis sp. FBCC-B4732 TaxID=3079339 RepID=UPI001FF39522|nr:hypothetical protein [Amycolatopsis sp. FBCC-B4732]UOX86008.1 hypothetical protein MUY14_30100 [Amycolatopsis sp. FBCC-B4732]
MTWELLTPEDFDWRDWLLAADRGVVLHAQLAHGDRRFPMMLFDSTRIVQVVEDEPRHYYYDANVVVVPEVTRSAAEEEIGRLGAEGRFDWLLSAGPGPAGAWSYSDGVLSRGDRRFPLRVFSPEELAVTLGWADLETTHWFGNQPRPTRFYAENLLVLPSSDPGSVAEAVSAMAADGSLAWLLE